MNKIIPIKVLLVEDDQSLGYVIKDNIEQEGLTVDLLEDGELAWEKFNTNQYQICVLDIMLPKMDGFQLAENIRNINAHIPIIFLSAKSMKEDKLKGFQLGADDYMVKPFNIEELILRMKVFIKRSTKENASSIIEIGKYLFNHSNLELQLNTSVKRLTQKQADLLKLLLDNREEVVKREQILKQLWGNDDYFAGRSMDVFISKLRKYLSEDNSIEIINYHGIGFKLELKK